MNADLLPDEPSELELPPDEPEEATDLDYVDMPCTDGSDDGDARWEAFIPDEDESDPQPDPEDFRIECAASNFIEAVLQQSLVAFPAPYLLV